MDFTILFQLLTALSIVIGIVAGLVKIFKLVNESAVNLEVTPNHVIPTGGISHIPIDFGISAVNMSKFPVVINDLGFTLKSGKKLTLGMCQKIENPRSLPIKLEPREEYSAFFGVDEMNLSSFGIKGAYVQTACGHLATGSSEALEQIANGS